MPKVQERVKSTRGATRTCGRCGRAIQPGESYFTWAFRYGGQRFACKDHRPRPSELTQSKLSEVYAAIEAAEDALPTTATLDKVRDLVADVAEAATNVAGEYRDAAEAFGGEGENAERADELEGWAYELEGFDPEGHEDGAVGDQSALDTARSEAEELLGGCPL